ncbi:unnamed protein product, partial [Closterium sp. NIES-53]
RGGSGSAGQQEPAGGTALSTPHCTHLSPPVALCPHRRHALLFWKRPKFLRSPWERSHSYVCPTTRRSFSAFPASSSCSHRRCRSASSSASSPRTSRFPAGPPSICPCAGPPADTIPAVSAGKSKNSAVFGAASSVVFCGAKAVAMDNARGRSLSCSA